MAQRIRAYELVMILSPEATEEEVASTVDRVEGLIIDKGGTVSEREDWGVRRLAYPIKKFAEGNYVLRRFDAEASVANDLNQNLRAAEDVLRYLMVKP